MCVPAGTNTVPLGSFSGGVMQIFEVCRFWMSLLVAWG
jgi:hypothetical protein